MHQPTGSVAQAFQTWKANLVDLTTENPLLYFRPDRNALRIVLPTADDMLKQFLAADAPQPFRLVRSAAPRETGVIVGRDEGAVLRALRQRALLAQDEQGVQILYLTFGHVSWTSNDGEAIDSPILILPVRLERDTAFAYYRLSLAEPQADLTFNPALAIKLQQDYGVDLSEVVSKGLVSLDAVLEAVRESIADHFD